MQLQGHKVRIYDNGGETIDRFTVIIDNDFFAMSERGKDFNQYCGSKEDGYKAGPHLGKKLTSYPNEDIKKAIIDRFEV